METPRAPEPSTRLLRAAGVAACLLLAAVGALGDQPPDSWRAAEGPRAWAFPQDHGAHPDYRTEWWYFTGNLRDARGLRYGYQLTFFRQGVRRETVRPENPWSVRDVYLAHLALTEGASGRFRFADRLGRAGPGLAGASEKTLDVWLRDWSARLEQGRVRLRASASDWGLELDLAPRKPVVLHGEQGLSRKGPAAGQASYYASYTDLATSGTLLLGGAGEGNGERVAVTGTSWFDQEFGSNQLTRDQSGWDWFSLHLSDGRDLMAYLLRRKDGSVEPSSSGTLVEPDGRALHLPLERISVEVLGRWTSPRTGGEYPARWRLEAPGISLEFAPLAADQELETGGSTGVVYWEGAVEGRGTSEGRPVTCEGYVELTGYAGSLGGLF